MCFWLVMMAVTLPHKHAHAIYADVCSCSTDENMDLTFCLFVCTCRSPLVCLSYLHEIFFQKLYTLIMKIFVTCAFIFYSFPIPCNIFKIYFSIVQSTNQSNGNTYLLHFFFFF